MVKVISVVPGVDTVYGSTVTVTIERDGEFVTCANILQWDDTQVDDYLFETWSELALDGEEDFTYESDEGWSV
mgnify:FL=1